VMFPYKLYNRVDLCTQGQFKCVKVFFINIVNNSFSKFSKDVNSILFSLDGTIHFWTPCQELVLLYDMIEWLMNILHSMPGVYLNEICTPCQEFIWTPCQNFFLDFTLHARSLLFMNIFCSMPGVLMILRNIQISTPWPNFRQSVN
jgi:hypothetical protein